MLHAATNLATKYQNISPEEVAALPSDTKTVLLDVRTPQEWSAYHIPGAILIPVQELAQRTSELTASRPVICICEHGIRSEYAAEYLAQLGFADVSNMSGGMARWNGPVVAGENAAE